MNKPKISFKRVWTAAADVMRPLIVPLILIISALGLLGYHLFRHVPYGPPEFAVNLGSATLSAIKNDILFAPVKGVQIAALKFTDNDIYMRLASVAVGLVAAVLLYAMLRRWYTTRVSFLASVMFITSSWFLHQGRLANLDVMYLTILPALLLICLWFLSKHNDKKYPLAAILLSLTLYVPGTWLFIAGGLFFVRKVALKALRKVSLRIRLVSATALLLTLTPLFYSFALKPGQLTRWLGIDTGQELSLQAIGGRLFDIPQQLLLTGPDDATRWLTGTPVFEVFSLAMIIMGLYAFRTGYYPTREKLVFGALAIGCVLVGFGNVVTLGILIPLLYIVIANGLSYMLQSWFTVFPRNPLARSTGVVLLVLVIAGSCFYQLQRYFVAWPAADATTKALTVER